MINFNAENNRQGPMWILGHALYGCVYTQLQDPDVQLLEGDMVR